MSWSLQRVLCDPPIVWDIQDAPDVDGINEELNSSKPNFCLSSLNGNLNVSWIYFYSKVPRPVLEYTPAKPSSGKRDRTWTIYCEHSTMNRKNPWNVQFVRYSILLDIFHLRRLKRLLSQSIHSAMPNC